MRHLDPNPDAEAAVIHDPAWLALSAAFTGQSDVLAGRDDLVVSVVPGAGRGAPGCFLPALANIEVDGNLLADVDPATADPARVRDRSRYPVAWGVFVHEAGGHAAHTAWQPPEGAGEAEVAAAMLLEEARIEGVHLADRPGDRRWLRASASALVLPDPATVTIWSAAKAAALVLAREDAGVFDPDEAAPVAEAVERALGSDRLAALRGVWQDALVAADDDGEAMVALGRRWCELTDVDPAGSDPDGDSAGGGGGEGTAADGSGAPSPVAAAVEAAIAAVKEADAADAAAEEAAERAAAERAAARAAEATALGRARTRAAEVFGPHGHGMTGAGRAAWTTRLPVPAERAAARQLAAALRRARYRERDVTTVTSAMPPGRLRMRGAITAAAQRSAGRLPTAEPWARTVRRHVPSPPLRIGIGCDVSSSMGWSVKPLSATVWVVDQAAAHSEGVSATVAFGERVTAISRPGEASPLVREFAAPDGTEAFCEAVDALDGALNLSVPGLGARMLVIVSDGWYTPDQYSGGQARITRLLASGCAVVWVTFGNANPMAGAQVAPLTDPAEAGRVIGAAAERALRLA